MNQDDVLKALTESVQPTKCVNDSFNAFVRTEIKKMVLDMKPIDCQYHSADGTTKRLSIRIDDFKIVPPMVIEGDSTSRHLLPHEARLRGLDYNSPMYLCLNVERSDGKQTHISHAYFGRLPVMVLSNLCHAREKKNRVENKECEFDQGGCFIIKGNEKVLVSQKQGWSNRVTTFKKNAKCSSGQIKSEFKMRQYITTIKFQENAVVQVLFPRLQREIPLMTLVVALGCGIDDIKSFFSIKEVNLLRKSLENVPKTTKAAQESIVLRGVYDPGMAHSEKLQLAFERMLLPHIAGGDRFVKKICFLLIMLKQVLSVHEGEISPTDRDSLIHQRVNMSFTLLKKMFYQLLIKFNSDMTKSFNINLAKLRKPITDQKIRSILSSYTGFTDGLNFSMSTGVWNTSLVDSSRLLGVSQVFQRSSYKSSITHLLKVVSSGIDKEMKNPQPRFLHSTHYRRLCKHETPEGGSCGLDCTLAASAYVSLETDPEPILGVLKQYLLPLSIQKLSKGKSVFINGAYVGNTLNESRLISTVRNGRRTGIFAKDMSVSGLLSSSIHISTTLGRICCPLIIVENGKPNLPDKQISWSELLRTSCVEYLDAEEENECLVAFSIDGITVEHTHLEISNTLSDGANAASIPFSDRNPCPRNIFQCAMGKQAQGVPQMTFMNRMDTTTNILNYQQYPLVNTTLGALNYPKELSAGCNAVIAIMCYGGWNQEDSIIINQDAVDRGLFRSARYVLYQDTAQNNSKEKSIFAQPDKRKRKRTGDYSKLDVDGLLPPGTDVKKRDAVFGKETVRNLKHRDIIPVTEDASRMSRVEGVVDRTIVYQTKAGSRAAKTMIRIERIPEIGDKFCSRHGQKGTCGMLVPAVDLPFSQCDGISPDIIINPHAIPSRMTIGHLVESLAGKSTALSGKDYNSDPFSGTKIEDIMSDLKTAGYNSKGNETLISGTTGEMLKAKIFISPCYYQRLRHMVADKAHARAKGPVNALTMQPVEGRARDGGLRLGEMEVQAVHAWGASSMLQDRLLHCSDGHDIQVCELCGVRIEADTCNNCNRTGKKVKVPYAMTLLSNELKSMGVVMKLKV
jgi:DNA-directed RNA polymerase II subunit RPB2